MMVLYFGAFEALNGVMKAGGEGVDLEITELMDLRLIPPGYVCRKYPVLSFQSISKM
jgi:hypothetical protein